MDDPTDGPRHPTGPPSPAGAGATEPDDEAEPRPAGDPFASSTAEVTARAAADVTLLLSRAVGLRRAVELAERTRRAADSSSEDG